MAHTEGRDKSFLSDMPSVQILGRIESIHPTTEFEGYSFVIADAHEILDDCKLGDSIAVNGCCLTVTRFDAGEGWFEVGLANETLSRTNLGPLPFLFFPRTTRSARLP